MQFWWDSSRPQLRNKEKVCEWASILTAFIATHWSCCRERKARPHWARFARLDCFRSGWKDFGTKRRTALVTKSCRRWWWSPDLCRVPESLLRHLRCLKLLRWVNWNLQSKAPHTVIPVTATIRPTDEGCCDEQKTAQTQAVPEHGSWSAMLRKCFGFPRLHRTINSRNNYRIINAINQKVHDIIRFGNWLEPKLFKLQLHISLPPPTLVVRGRAGRSLRV